MKFRSKNLLITGGAGFIGSNFINYILKKYKNIKIINLDKLTYAGNIRNTNDFIDNPNYKFIKGDICDLTLLNEIFFDNKIDGVINFAAESHVDNSIENPKVFVDTNVIGVFSLLNISYKYWFKSPFHIKDDFSHARFHQISTDEIYGSIKLGSFDESSKMNPSSPYSGSKAAADMMVNSFHKTYGMNVTTSICSNNYGNNQHAEKLIPKILDSINKYSSVKIYGDGSNVRNWINVEDHCRAIEIIYNKANSGQKFNVGGKSELSNLELVNLLYEIYDKKPVIEFVKDRHGHDFRYSINYKKISSKLGWQPKIDLYNFYKNTRHNDL